MLDPRSANRPRSRSTSMLSLRLPHITVEVDNTFTAASTAHEARQPDLDMSITRSVPTPTIHIVDDFGGSSTNPHPADCASDEVRYGHRGASGQMLRPDSEHHRMLSMQEATEREESFRRLTAAASAYRWPSSEGRETEGQASCHPQQRIPTLKHQPSAAFSCVSSISRFKRRWLTCTHSTVRDRLLLLTFTIFLLYTW